MDEYISREKAIKELREVYEQEYPTASGDFDEYASHDIPNVLRNIPTADIQPVKHGRWIKCDYKRLDDAGEVQTYIGQGVYCSKCRTGFHKNEVKNWIGCPCCLTRMDGERNG